MKNHTSPPPGGQQPARRRERLKPRLPSAYDNSIHGLGEFGATAKVGSVDFPAIKATDLPIDILFARLQHLGRAIVGSGPWQASCPAHADVTPSLSIDETADDVLLIYCHAGCTAEAILAALGLAERHLYPSLYAQQFGQREACVVTNCVTADSPGEVTEPTDEECAEWSRRHAAIPQPTFAVNQLAVSLKLPRDAVARLEPRYRECGPRSVYGDDSPCWVLPERDDRDRIVGLVYRLLDGEKLAMAGSYRGLTILRYPDGPPPGPLYLAEGASDTAALSSVGAFAIGRPAARASARVKLWLERLLSRYPDRQIVVVGDRDRYCIGGGVGETQAKELASHLAGALGREVVCAMPAEGYKDVREQVVAEQWHRGLVLISTPSE